MTNRRRNLTKFKDITDNYYFEMKILKPVDDEATVIPIIIILKFHKKVLKYVSLKTLISVAATTEFKCEL